MGRALSDGARPPFVDHDYGVGLTTPGRGFLCRAERGASRAGQQDRGGATAPPALG
jgi:hypothetical protein